MSTSRLLPLLVLPTMLASLAMQLVDPAFAAEAPFAARLADGMFTGQVAGIPLVLNVATPAGAAQGCTLDSPQQGAKGIPCAEFRIEGETLSFRVPTVNASWTGRIVEGGAKLEGNWTQGVSMPLNFARGGTIAEPKRPQMPQEPYPYLSEEVRFANPAATGVQLAGTLTRPRGNGPFPAVLLVTGSGAQDRDETLFGHKPFLVLADHLTRQGIAVLRVDDRGVGSSTGATGKETTEDFASDARAGLAWLRAQGYIDAARVGVLGHSEGALIAAQLANSDTRLAFAVLLAVPAVNGRDLLVEQVRALSLAAGQPRAAADAAADLQQRVMQALVDAKDDEAAVAAMRKVLGDAGAPADDASLRQMVSPWYRHFLALDPAPLLRGAKAPVLALAGGRDVQVPAAQNEPKLRELLRGQAKSEVVLLPELNHLMQTARTGHPSEYGVIEETIAPAALQKIGEWISAVTR